MMYVCMCVCCICSVLFVSHHVSKNTLVCVRVCAYAFYVRVSSLLVN